MLVKGRVSNKLDWTCGPVDGQGTINLSITSAAVTIKVFRKLPQKSDTQTFNEFQMKNLECLEGSHNDFGGVHYRSHLKQEVRFSSQYILLLPLIRLN